VIPHLHDVGSVQAINAVGADHAVLGGDQLALGVNKGISGCLSQKRIDIVNTNALVSNKVSYLNRSM